MGGEVGRSRDKQKRCLKLAGTTKPVPEKSCSLAEKLRMKVVKLDPDIPMEEVSTETVGIVPGLGREGAHLFEHPDSAGLPKHRADTFIHLPAKLIFGPCFPVLSSAPYTDYYKGPGIIHGAPGLAIHVAPLSDRLASQIPQLLPDSFRNRP